MILLPLRMSLLRMLPTAVPISNDFAGRWDFVYGNHDWYEIYRLRLSDRLSPTDARQQYLELYKGQLKRLGYRHVITKPVIAPRLAGSPRQEMYHLVFASDNDAGEAIMNDLFERGYVLDYPVSGQLTLPEG
jgi:hypothetical protein